MDVGPGTVVICILFLIQCFINLKPGSDISGDPASDIKTIFLLNKSLDNLSIIICSLWS